MKNKPNKDGGFIMKAKRIILPVFAALLAVMFALTLEQVSATQWNAYQWPVSSWAELQKAINEAEEGEVIVLEKDIQAGDQDTPLEVPDRNSVSVTIDLNGHVLDRNLSDPADKGNLFNVEGSLTIIDSAPDTPHKDGDNNDIYSYKIGERTIGVTGGIITGGNLSGNGGAIYVDGGRTLILNGGTIIGNKASGVDGSNGNNTGQGGGVYIGGSGTFEMNGGAVAGNVAFSEENGDDRYNRGDGGGVYMAGSTFNLNGGTVAGNTAEQDMSNPDHCGNAGGVYLSNGTLNMKGGSIEGNTSVKDGGGGVYMTIGSKLYMEGGSIINNSAPNGGGVFTEHSTVITVKNASIEGNQAGSDGGGVYLHSSELTLNEGAEISDNSAGGHGGGIFFNSEEALPAHIYMNDGAISGNEATDGGGVYHGYLETAFDLKGGEISDNTAGSKGGGVYVMYGSLAMTGGTITGNRAAVGGGGVCTHSKSFSIAGKSEIFGNLHGNDENAGPDNVFIDKYGPDYYVGIGDTLNNEHPIGVWIDSGYLQQEDYRTVTSGYGEHIGAGDPREHFVSENDGYTVSWNNSGTELLLTKSPGTIKYTAAGYEGSYDSAEHSITVNVTEPTEGVTIQYRATGDQDYQADPPVYTNVGEYDVEYFIRADGVEYSVRDKETVTIKPASQTVTVPKTTYAKTYGNAAFSLGAKTNGDGVLKYSSSNTKVAAVSAAGKVTIKGAGTAKISVYATAGTNYQKSATKTVTVKVGKAANKLKIKRGKTATVKYSAVKTKNQKLGVSKVIAFTNKGQGAKTYAKVSGNKKITIAKKTGKVTVKKGLKKGKYTVKVKVKAAGTANYKASAWKTVTFKITVK